MQFFPAIVSGFRQYVTIKGRAPRSAYWYWILFYILLNLVCVNIDNFLAGGTMTPDHQSGPVELSFLLLVFLPTIALSVRRLHDINRSGWWLLIATIPVIGAIVLIIWHCTKGTEGDNRFGADPLATAQ